MDVFLLIVGWIFGVLIIWVGFPQVLLVGLFRSIKMRFSMAMPTFLRIIWDTFIGFVCWRLTSALWSLVYNYDLPLIFVFGYLIWSFYSNFLQGEWKNLTGLSQGNEIATLGGAVLFVIFSFISDTVVYTPNIPATVEAVGSQTVYGPEFVSSNEELQSLLSVAQELTILQIMGLKSVHETTEVIRLEDSEGLSAWFSAWQEISRWQLDNNNLHLFLEKYNHDFPSKSQELYDELCKWLNDPQMVTFPEVSSKLNEAKQSWELTDPELSTCEITPLK
jgi:hypothetical protein